MAVSERVERNLLRSIVNEEVDNHCYSEFSIRKIYHSGALDRSSIINCKRRKMQGFPFGYRLSFLSKNISLWVLDPIPHNKLQEAEN
jgi:hypothetical protein